MKPGPDPEKTAALAKKKAHGEELTLHAWLAMVRNAGVERVRFVVVQGCFSIRLDRNEEVFAPFDHPIDTYAMAALEQARGTEDRWASLGDKKPYTAPEVKEDDGTLAAVFAAEDSKRKPLALPLCSVCKSQPVYSEHAIFCGGECARKHFMKKAGGR